MSVQNLYLLYGKLRHYYQSYLAHNNFTGSLIKDNIYIGNIYDAYDIETLNKLKINNVISAVIGFDNIYDNNINHLPLTLIDNEHKILFIILKYQIILLIILSKKMNHY